jgi:RND family efflux transporter MFP subunit
MTLVIPHDARHFKSGPPPPPDSIKGRTHNKEPAMQRPSQQKSQALLGAAALSALSLAVLAACGQALANETVAPAPPPPEVTVARPVSEPVAEFSEHAGRFVATKEIDVRPRVSGFLQEVHFREGDTVEKGQLLFVIDPAPFQAEVDRSRAQLNQAEASLALAAGQLSRGETLFKAGAMSAEEFDRRRESVASARASRDAARAALRANQLSLGYTRVYAPISGRISDTTIDPGNLVQSGESVLTRIVALDPIHFEFAAAEGLLSGAGGPRLTGDEEVAVKLEGEDGYTHIGRLDFIDNAIDPRTGTIRGRAVFVNDGSFTPGQYGRLRVLTAAGEPSLLVPETAISTDQSRKYVLVVNKENVVEYRPVTLGQPHGDLRVIRAGLEGDERVVVNGIQRAFPGAPVTPQPVSSQAAASTPSPG